MTIEESTVNQIKEFTLLTNWQRIISRIYVERKVLFEHIFLTTTLALCKSQIASSIDGTKKQFYSGGKRREEC
jgi:hypothetical protein